MRNNLPFCFCGKQVTAKTYIYCSAHRATRQKGKGSYQKNLPCCQICDKKLSQYGLLRCRSHRVTSDSARLNMSIASIKRGSRPPVKVGSGNCNWKGGVSKSEGYRQQVNRERRVRKLSADGTHTYEEWQSLKMKYNFTCLCCKQQEPFVKLTEDHIVPLSRGGSDSIGNIQPLCRSCNSRKMVKSLDYRTLIQTT